MLKKMINYSALALFSPLFFPFSVEAHPDRAIPPGPEEFTCGTYSLSGILKKTKTEFDLLLLYPETSREFEFLLEKAPAKISFTRDNSPIKVLVKVERKETGNNSRGIFLKLEGIPTFEELSMQPIQLVEKGHCQ